MPSQLYNFAKKTALSLVYKLPALPERIQGKLIWAHPRARLSLTAKTFFKGEAHVQTWLTEQLKWGHVFFDVGAHHGWVSIWALLLVGKEGAVYSFEPSPANLAILEWHKSVNNFSHWIVVPRAIADEDAAERQFFLIDSGDSPMNSLTSGVPGMPLMEGRDIGKISIQTLSLDTFCREVGVRPNVVKIDVEGAELLVLRGARKLLSEAHPILILAVHPYWLPAQQSSAQIAELLKAHGYKIFNSKGNLVESLRSGEYLCLNAKAELH